MSQPTPILWLYRAELVHVVDGDTVDLRVSRDVDFGFRMQHVLSAVMRFRIAGIDTPERTGPTRDMGVWAASYLLVLLREAQAIQVESLGEPDKYGGRWDARIHVLDVLDEPPGWIDVSEHLVQRGYAQRYDGRGPRPAWDPTRRYPLAEDA